jgi:predicted Zn finger-like uncharacterized protein
MSLATRCTSCGTVFRVAEEQLRVSDGWVRCGRCEAVFNAAESLLELEPIAGMHPASSATAAHEVAAQPQADLPEPLWDRRNALNAPEPGASWAEEPARFDAEPSQPSPEPAWQEDDSHQAAFDQRREPQLQAAAAPVSAASRAAAPSPLRQQPAPAPASHEPARPRPEKSPPRRPVGGSASSEPASGVANTEFMRRAAIRARWSRPAVVQGLALLLAVLALSLALQVAHHQRDMLAARWPAAAGALQAWCVVAGCSIKAPQRIEDLVLDSATLSQLGPNSQAVKLSITLRNRGSTRVALPAIDLTLTDVNGKPVLRRALMPGEFQVIQGVGNTLAAGTEQTLNMVFKVNNLSYAGYHAEIFYP